MPFFKKVLKGQQVAPIKIVTDKLKSYSAAKRELMPSVDHSKQQYENNGCELARKIESHTGHESKKLRAS